MTEETSSKSTGGGAREGSFFFNMNNGWTII